jgi:hypothetical protein
MGGLKLPVRRDDKLTTFIADSVEIWESQNPGTISACQGVYRDGFTFTFTFTFYSSHFLQYESDPRTAVMYRFKTVWISYQTIQPLKR